jgi:hypothetical protein
MSSLSIGGANRDQVASATIPQLRKSRVGRSAVELDRNDVDLDHRAVALDADGHAPANHVADHDPLEVADAFNRSTVELDDDVAGPNARGRRRASLEQLDDLEASSPAETLGEHGSQGPGSAHDAEERSPDATVVHERRDDRPRRRIDRNGKTESDSGNRRVDPDDAPATVRQRTTRVPWVERGIGLDDVLDEPARPAIACGK